VHRPMVYSAALGANGPRASGFGGRVPEETTDAAAATRDRVRAARIVLLAPHELRAGHEVLGFAGVHAPDVRGPLARYLARGGRGHTVAAVATEPNGWLAMSLASGRSAPLLLDPGCRVLCVDRGGGS